MDSFLVGAQLVLAAVFAVAGVAKLFDLTGSARAVADFGVPVRLARPAGVALPLAEILTAALLLFVPTARWGALLALVLLVAFVAGVANAMRQGKDVDCGCFGPIYSATAGSKTLIRNGALAVLAAVVVVKGAGPAIDGWVADRSAAELVAIGVTVLALVLAIVAVVLWGRYRKLMEVAGEVRRQQNTDPDTTTAGAAPSGLEPQGLPVGTRAPGFELPNATGGVQSLDSLLARGKPVMLTFMAVGCGPCGKVRPEIARLRASVSDRLTFAVVYDGTADKIRELWADFGVDDVLLDDDDQVLRAYKLRKTPVSLLIDPDGTIVTRPSPGMLGTEVLVRHALRRRIGFSRPEAAVSSMPPVIQVAPRSA
jgi:peroxiredoxin